MIDHQIKEDQIIGELDLCSVIDVEHIQAIKLTGTTIFGSPATDYFCYFSYSGVEPIWDQIAAHHLEVAVLSSVTFLSIYGNTMVTLVMATLAACQLLQPTITKYGTGFIGSINLFSSGF